MSNKPRIDSGTRKKQILKALAVTPLTARQLEILSVTFKDPFTGEEFIRRVLGRMRDRGEVLEFKFPNGKKYWRPSRLGYKEIYGPDKPTPKKKSFYRPIATINEHHSRRLAELLVKLQVSAFFNDYEVLEIFGDRQIELALENGRTKFPDGAIKLKIKSKGRKNYYNLKLELDCGSEWGYTSEAEDSLNKVIQFYLDHEAQSDESYKMIMLFDEPTVRLQHFMKRVETLNPHPDRRVIKAGLLDKVLLSVDPFQEALILDWDLQATSIVPGKKGPLHTVPAPQLDLAAVAC